MIKITCFSKGTFFLSHVIFWGFEYQTWCASGSVMKKEEEKNMLNLVVSSLFEMFHPSTSMIFGSFRRQGEVWEQAIPLWQDHDAHH